MAEVKKKGETYTAILKNAKKEFLQNGFEKASMRSIAAMTGITAGALYKHFPSKAAIFDALVQPLIAQTLRIGTDFSAIAVHLFKTEDSNACLCRIYFHLSTTALMNLNYYLIDLQEQNTKISVMNLSWRMSPRVKTSSVI